MAEQVGNKPKRRLKNYLLNKQLQLRYVLWVLCLSAFIAVSLGLVIYDQSTYASEQIMAELASAEMAWLDPTLKEQVGSQLSSSDMRVVAAMGGLGLAVALVLFLSLIVMTHRVAGPLFRLRRYFEAMAEGQLPPVGGLRPGDHFGGIFETLSATRDAIVARAAADRQAALLFIEACEAAAGQRDPAFERLVDTLRTRMAKTDSPGPS